MLFRSALSLVSDRATRYSRFGALVVLSAGVIGMAGCGDDDGPTGGASAAVGTYTLVQTTTDGEVDNTAPFLIFSQTVDGFDFEFRVNSSTLTVRSNNTFTSTAVVTFTVDGEGSPETITDNGTWSANGNTYTFITNDDPQDPTPVADRTTTATFSGGNTLTLTERFDDDDDPSTADLVFTAVYRK